MFTEARREAAVCALPGVLSVPVLFFGLADYSAVHMDELLYHGVARQMLASGDFLRLEFGGELRTYDALMNAPVHYWVKAPLIAIFGDGLGYDPFSAVARSVPSFEWANAGPPAAWLGVPLSAAVLAAVVRKLPSHELAAGLVALVLLVGSARVLSPLQFLGYQSEIEKLRAEVDRARANGESLPNPLLHTREANESGLTRVWYFFGDDYWIVPQRAGGKRSRIVALYDRVQARPPGLPRAPAGEGEEH